MSWYILRIRTNILSFIIVMIPCAPTESHESTVYYQLYGDIRASVLVAELKVSFKYSYDISYSC